MESVGTSSGVALLKIFFYSRPFHPNVGGLETVSLLLAREFVRAGHDVVVVTESSGDGGDGDFPFAVIRHPSFLQFLRLTIWADIVFHNNVSLRAAWPLLLIRKPWVVAHHVWLPTGKGLSGVKSALKRFVFRFATNIAVSRVISDQCGTACTVIANPYEHDVFRRLSGIDRGCDLVFVGRFVEDKGLPDLLHALVKLKPMGITPNLSVIGAGPQDAAWRKMTEELALSSQVRFTGLMRGQALVEELNRHRILVVPSRCQEAFGVVVLEGMACGCLVIGADSGGLGEAIGAGGVIYPSGNIEALADCIVAGLSDQGLIMRCRDEAISHLSEHRPTEIAKKYLRVFSLALGR